MLLYILKRLASTAIVMLTVAGIVFLLLHLSDGDPAVVIAGDSATSEQIDVIRRKMGLNDPLPVQFFQWLGQVLRADLGTSVFSNSFAKQFLCKRTLR